MIPNQIENSIIKYLNSEATVTELEQLEVWLANSNNQEVFKDYVKINFLIDINSLTFDNTTLLKALSKEMQKDKVYSLRLRTFKIMRYAAVFILLISASYSTYYFNFSNNPIEEQPLNDVVLKSENGSINVLSQDGTTKIKNRDGEVLFEKIEDNLVYKANTKTAALTYNTITVPYGRQFSLELSDGTKVQLNAGTSLRFPVEFLEGRNREVFIEYGEAFFDVAKDSKHPFVVYNKDIDITVLGTEFNVSAYPEDMTVSTVLVEGSVQLSDASLNKENIILKPGYKALWSKDIGGFNVSEADIELHTGWRTGKVVLKSLPFSTMIKKLERHYDVRIQNKDKQLDKEVITATFKGESIEEVLKLINEIHPIAYKIKGKQIEIINQ